LRRLAWITKGNLSNEADAINCGALLNVRHAYPIRLGGGDCFVYPANGNIRIDQSDCRIFYFIRNKGTFNPGLAAVPPITIPTSSPAPKFSLAEDGKWLVWQAVDEPVFSFDSLILYNAIPPDDNFELLSFGYVPNNEFFPVWVPINIVPEPSTLALGSVAILSLAALRRRK